MSFFVVILIVGVAAIVMGMIFKGHVDEALVILLFTPLAVLYLGLTDLNKQASILASFETFFTGLQSNIIGICAWVFALLLIHVWRQGYPQEIANRIQDVTRDNHVAGYTASERQQAGPASAALMGASTSNFSRQVLPIRDVTLIKLTVFAMGTFNRKTHIVLEAQVKAPSDQRANVQTLISTQLGSVPESLPNIVRPFLRDTAGNYDIPQKVMSDLCAVAVKTGNNDTATRSRLEQVARHLGVSHSIVAKAFHRF